jgi:hypothetical protein
LFIVCPRICTVNRSINGEVSLLEKITNKSTPQKLRIDESWLLKH